MTDIDDVLEQCLTDIFTGDSTLDECLARYPEHFEQLEPLLRTASRVEMGSSVRPAPVFKVHARNRLLSHMQAYPRQKEVVSHFPFRRLMAGAIALLATLFVTGTVYAQGVLPGDPFYIWKINSERAWRLVSSDSVVTDLRIANRRINEMNVTAHDQVRWTRALDGYNEVRSRLEVEVDSETLDTILPPAKLFNFPDAVTATPVQITEPLSTLNLPETSAPKDISTPAVIPTKEKDKEDNNEEKGKEKDKNKDKGQKNKGTGTEEPQESDFLPTPTTPVIIPTIEIPPPVQ